MNATGRDLTYLRAMIADNQGTMLPDANHIITFSIDGPAELIAVDNGDPDSHSIFNSNKIDAFHGLCIAIVRSTRNPGKVTVRAHAEGLEPTYTIINSIQPT